MTALTTSESSQHVIRPRPTKRTKVMVISKTKQTASNLKESVPPGPGHTTVTTNPATPVHTPFSTDSESLSAKRISQALKAQRCPTNKEISPFCKFSVTFKH